MNEDQTILWGLKFLKGSAGDSWRPDDGPQAALLIVLEWRFPDLNLNATTLRRRIEEFEIMVKADIVSSAIHIIVRNLF
jgi:hypothetical protein